MFFFNDTATTEIYTLALHDAAITPAQWAAAGARNPDLRGDAVTISRDPEDLPRALREAEVLVTWPEVIHRRFAPGQLAAQAPRLRAIFCATAETDRLAPFDWLPPRVHLLDEGDAEAGHTLDRLAAALRPLRAAAPPSRGM